MSYRTLAFSQLGSRLATQVDCSIWCYSRLNMSLHLVRANVTAILNVKHFAVVFHIPIGQKAMTTTALAMARIWVRFIHPYRSAIILDFGWDESVASRYAKLENSLSSSAAMGTHTQPNSWHFAVCLRQSWYRSHLTSLTWAPSPRKAGSLT